MKLLRIPGTVCILLLSLLALSLSTSVPLAWAKVGTITEFPISTACPPSSFACLPQGITLGPDGKMWFTETGGEKIGRITTSGAITEFPVGSFPFGITTGPDGNLWFTESISFCPNCSFPSSISSSDLIGRITTGGTVTEFSLTSGSGPNYIAAGPDGNLWFTEGGTNKIGRITTSGAITEFPLPTNCGQPVVGCVPVGITAGRDSNLWFTEPDENKVGRITTAGVITEFTIPTANSQPFGIASGRGNKVWFTEAFANQIGSITIFE